MGRGIAEYQENSWKLQALIQLLVRQNLDRKGGSNKELAKSVVVEILYDVEK